MTTTPFGSGDARRSAHDDNDPQVAQSIELPLGASDWEREIFDHVTGHAEQEISLLKKYARAAEATQSKALAYLVNLLLEDERRHHRLFMELAESLKADVELRSEDPIVPSVDFESIDAKAVLDLTNELLERELSDAADLKRLRRSLRDVEDSTLWGILVDLMQRDTEKHIAILRFVTKHTKAPRQ